MAKSTVAVKFTGDANSLKSALGDVDSRMSGLGGKLAGSAKVMVAGLAGAAAGAVALGKSFYDAAIESQKVTKQTEAVIKSMGGASKITADQVGELSTKLSMQSGVDDELIQSGENVLLTFENIRNEVGKGNDIFTRATKTALDMSVALGSDLKGANIQLGKALNDPIKGVTALSRVGVSFTEQQKEQIKTLVKSGDVLGAQKLILGEVEKEFKGSAAAQATAGEKLKVVWGNLQETLGAKLIPVVETAASFLADKLPGALDKLGSVAGPIFKNLGDGWDAFMGGLENPGAINNVKGLTGTLINLGAGVGQFWETLTTGLTQNDAATGVEKFALKVREVALGIQTALQAVVAWVQQNWPQIQQVIGSVMETVGSIISGALTVIEVLWDNFGNNIWSFVQRVWPPIQQVIEGVMLAIRSIIQIVTSLIQGDWAGVWEGIRGLFEGVWNAIQGIVKAALEAIRLAIGVALEVIGSVVKGALDGIAGFFAALPGRLVGALAGLAGLLANVATNAMRAFLQAHVTVAQQVISFVGGVPSKIVHALGNVGHLLYDAGVAIMKSLLDGVTAGFKAVGHFVGGVAHKIASLKGPLDFDAVLLIPHGNAIMDSLLTGLQEKYGPVLGFVRRVTGDISSAASDAVGESAAFLATLATGFTAAGRAKEEPDDSGATPDEARALAIRRARGITSVGDLAAQAGSTNGVLNASALQYNAQLAEFDRIQRDGTKGLVEGIRSAFGIDTSGGLAAAVAEGVSTATATASDPQQAQIISLLQQLLAVLQNPGQIVLDGQSIARYTLGQLAQASNRGLSIAGL